ncbi:MAG TPA: NAD-dependent protein deacylase [Candidatus Omnitrophota bacterium]|nr:NAD-dependent protein deacylase [Candidatus Omnitrophota bacterium]
MRSAQIKKVAALLRNCKSILCITGAGISADSGLPTYRGTGGLYDDKVTEDGVPIETALAGEMLQKKPEITWKYLFQIERRCRHAKHNRAHEILAEMERDFERVWILTQNIDGFHHAAGSKNVIDIHGDMHEILCERCGWQTRVDSYDGLDIPPRCPECRTIVRPDVVFFGECLPPHKVDQMERELGQMFDIYFSIGTTSVFPYIRYPMTLAAHFGKPTVEINPDKTDISGLVDIKISMGAADALQAVWKEYQG